MRHCGSRSGSGRAEIHSQTLAPWPGLSSEGARAPSREQLRRWMIRHVPSLEVVQAQWSLLPLAELSVWFLERLQGAAAVREGVHTVSPQAGTPVARLPRVPVGMCSWGCC